MVSNSGRSVQLPSIHASSHPSRIIRPCVHVSIHEMYIYIYMYSTSNIKYAQLNSQEVHWKFLETSGYDLIFDVYIHIYIYFFFLYIYIHDTCVYCRFYVVLMSQKSPLVLAEKSQSRPRFRRTSGSEMSTACIEKSWTPSTDARRSHAARDDHDDMDGIHEPSPRTM